MVEPPEFVRRLAPDPALARQSAFALFVLTYLEAASLSSGTLPLRDRIEAVAGKLDLIDEAETKPILVAELKVLHGEANNALPAAEEVTKSFVRSRLDSNER